MRSASDALLGTAFITTTKQDMVQYPSPVSGKFLAAHQNGKQKKEPSPSPLKQERYGTN